MCRLYEFLVVSPVNVINLDRRLFNYKNLLSCRSDNADIRLTEKGQAAGIVGPKRWKEFSALKHHLDCLRSILQGKTLSVSAWSKLLPEVSISPKSKVLSAYDILHRHGVTVERLSQVLPELDPFKERKDLERRLAVEGTYSVMNKRMMNKIEEVICKSCEAFNESEYIEERYHTPNALQPNFIINKNSLSKSFLAKPRFRLIKEDKDTSKANALRFVVRES